MTLKQRDFLIVLDDAAKELKIKTVIDEMLYDDWREHYENYVPEYASEVISRAKKQILMTDPYALKRRYKF